MMIILTITRTTKTIVMATMTPVMVNLVGGQDHGDDHHNCHNDINRDYH